MNSNRTVTKIARLTAGFIFISSTILSLLFLTIAYRKGSPSLEAFLDNIGPAILYLMFGTGLSAILLGISATLERRLELPNELTDSLNNLTDVVERIQHQLTEAPPQRETPEEHYESPALPILPSSPAIDNQSLHRMVRLLEDIREMSMMSEAQRQERLRRHMEHRKTSTFEQVDLLIQDHQWSKADYLLSELDQIAHDDAELIGYRAEFEKLRSAAESDAFAHVRKQADSFISTSSWDEAFQSIKTFTENFPRHTEGRHLLAQIAHDRDLHRETQATQTYEDVKRHIENRSWRLALSTAQRLLEQFPDHPKTLKIRPQMKLIQENAEIQERQEQEARIQELIHAQQFPEAIQLAEEILRRFPTSPQAESLLELLPKLRELAIQNEFDPTKE